MPIRTIALNGSFAQYKTGTYQANLDYKINQIDRINATGTGSLDGALDVRIHNRALVNPGFYKKAFFTAGEGLLEEDLQLVVKRSAIVDYGIEHDANNAFLTYDINFQGHGDNLNSNQLQIGDYLNRVQDAGSSAGMKSTIEAIFDIPSGVELKSAYNSMSPEPYTTSIIALKFSSNNFLKSTF